MIPTGGQLENEDMEEVQQPSRTWQLDFRQGRIVGMTDGLPAMQQAIDKIFQTERFHYLIYSFDYGVELESLIGNDPLYVQSELKRRIREGLLQDTRIQDIDDMNFSVNGDSILVSFTAVTDHGLFESTQEVKKRNV